MTIVAAEAITARPSRNAAAADGRVASLLAQLSPALRAEVLTARVHGEPLIGGGRRLTVAPALAALVEARRELALLEDVRALRLGWGDFLIVARRNARRNVARALARLQRVHVTGVRMGESADDVQLVA